MCVVNKRYLVKIMSMLSIIVIFLSFYKSIVNAEEDKNRINSDQIIEEKAESKEVRAIEEQLQNYSTSQIYEMIEGYDPQNIIKDAAKGNFELNIKGVLSRIFMFLFKEIYQNIHVMINLIILVVLCAVLKNLQSSFLSESVGEIAFYTCYIVIVSILLVSFNSAFKAGFQMIDKMVDFMYATMPVLITLLISGGNITSGGIFQPVLIMIVEISAVIIRNVFMPIIFLSAVMSVVDNISDKINLSQLAKFMRDSALAALGLIFTVFIAITTVQGTVGAVADGITQKTAKFAIGFIPVVGGYLSDAADTVIGCTLLIKNAAGLAVMVGVIVICIIPLLKVLALIVLYKVTCILVEPVSEKRITNTINEITKSLTVVFGIAAGVTFMFLILLTTVISASNLSTMVR